MRFFVALAMATCAFAERPVSFNRDIRPIMADTCFRCHGPDPSSRMAGIRLDIREEATKANRAGRRPIVPGKPEESQIIARVFHASPARVMPPPSAHKELTDQQKDTIRRWVAEGANYEGHWAYEPIRRGETKSIDQYVSARLAEVGLKPAPAADKRTLIRRVTLDLTGLPPTPAEVNAFLADNSPNAYDKVVDRLLASKAHAEKLTMHWLDAVRYGDSAGFHGDNLLPSWPYRDYVLNSFLANKRFDVFTREQLAGDLLPNATTEQKVGAAFNRLNRVSAEGGLQPKEYLAKYGADRVRTVSAVWLGATLGCAECHDHKFDPLLARDFYSMKAFFADIKETGLVPDRGTKAWGSVMSLPTPAQRQQLDTILQRLTNLRAAATRPVDDTFKRQLLADYESGKLAWRIQRPLTASSKNGSDIKIYNDEELVSHPFIGGLLQEVKGPGNGAIVVSGPNPDNETYTVTFRPAAGTYTALGLEVIHDDSNAANGVARGGDRLSVTEVEAFAGRRKLPFSLATSNVSDPGWEQPPMSAIDGNPATAWGVVTYGENKYPFLSLRFAQPFVANGKETLTVILRHDSDVRKATLGRFRLALSTARHSWPEGSDVTARNKRPGGLPDDVWKALRNDKDADPQSIARHRAWMETDLIEIARLEQQRHLLELTIPRVLATESVEPAETRILPRGNFLDETGAIVEPAIPVKFGKLNTGGRRATRLDLANWIVSPDNPLTARVQVNRLWRLFFGTGLSKVLDDLGSQGELPVNLDLLDALAADFQSDWDTRRLIRQIVLSHTYRQSSQPSKEALEKDPENRLLARQSRIRVDAEVVHDIALSASGLLNTDRFGGPSVRPYQPEGYLSALNFPKRDYAASRGKDLYARAVYTQWQRTFLHPSLMTFDAPTREECTVNRVNSNTPLQALVMLNDPTYVEAARVFAQRMLTEGGATFSAQLDWAFTRALSRPATADEKQILTDLHTKNLARFKADPLSARQILTIGDAPLSPRFKPEDIAAATTITRAILNLHETITRN